MCSCADSTCLVRTARVDVLKRKGVAASSLDSSLGLEETLRVKQSIVDESLKILYVAPEVTTAHTRPSLARCSELTDSIRCSV